MVFNAILNYVDDLLSMKWNPGLIPRPFKYVVAFMKVRIISLSLLFLVSVVRMALQSYTYITWIYLFPLLVVIG